MKLYTAGGSKANREACRTDQIVALTIKEGS